MEKGEQTERQVREEMQAKVDKLESLVRESTAESKAREDTLRSVEEELKELRAALVVQKNECMRKRVT